MTIPAEAIEQARGCDILEVAERFAPLKKIATNERAGPCPSCGGADRLGVNTRKQVFNCRGCGAKGGVIDLAMLALGVSFAEAVEYLAGPSPERIKPRKSAPSRSDEEDARKQHEKARWLWSRRETLEGSIAERYLREARGCGGLLPPTLGFLRAYKDHPPALIAAFAWHPGEVEPGVLAEPRDVQSVQLIALKSDGSGKADVEVVKRHIGGHKGVPIVVSPPNDGLGLSIHEGVEDALSAYEATGLGSWASGGATSLAALADAVPAYIECVNIIGHRDDAGQTGARELARKLAERGIEALIGDGPDG